MRAIGVGVCSRRKRPRNPPLFFFSAASAPPGSAGGGAHSSAREGTAFVGADSCCGTVAGAPQGSAFAGCSFGLALGAHAFAGASVEAGGGVVHDSGGLPPPGARHQSFGCCAGVSFASGAGACCGAFAAGPGAKRPERDESRSSTAGGTSTPGVAGSGTGANPPMRFAISFCRSSRIGGGGGAGSGSALCSVAVSGACHGGVVVLLDQSSVGRAGSTGAFGGEGGGAGSGSGAAYGAGRSAGRFSTAGNASMTPSFTRPERRVSVCIFPRR